MIIIGDDNIPYKSVSYIETIDDIKVTKPNSCLIFDFDIDIMKHLYNNSIEYGCVVTSLYDVTVASNLNAKYIIVDDKDFAISVQDIANHYMYDARIFVKAKSTLEIEWALLNKIDGVILWEKLFSHK
jgi:hypothetical protein